MVSVGFVFEQNSNYRTSDGEGIPLWYLYKYVYIGLCNY